MTKQDIYDRLDTKYPDRGGSKIFKQIANGPLPYKKKLQEIAQQYLVSEYTVVGWYTRHLQMRGRDGITMSAQANERNDG